MLAARGLGLASPSVRFILDEGVEWLELHAEGLRFWISVSQLVPLQREVHTDPRTDALAMMLGVKIVISEEANEWEPRSEEAEDLNSGMSLE